MTTKTRSLFQALSAAVLLLAAGSALADINVGVVVSATGPAASLGIPEKNTIALMPQTIGGQKIHYIVLDDGSDTTKAVSDTRKLITED
ncbi:MAG TPA: ABC transporter substrate-binding protein, partial [Burkholderiaceae bacterium]|nr:ABC transporter substrate-binding protein [Burkholderiaceae bacterium]